MDPKTKRKPVPAGGQPIPAAIAAAEATPPAGDAATDTTPPAGDAATNTAPPAGDAATNTAPPAADDSATEGAGYRDDDGVLFEAAVLVAFGDHQVDDIISATHDEINALWLAGTVDPHPDAVAFVRSLKA